MSDNEKKFLRDALVVILAAVGGVGGGYGGASAQEAVLTERVQQASKKLDDHTQIIGHTGAIIEIEKAKIFRETAKAEREEAKAERKVLDRKLDQILQTLREISDD